MSAAGFRWLWRDAFGHRVAAGEGWVAFVRRDADAGALVAFGLVVLFPVAWGLGEAALGRLSGALAGPWPAGALSLALCVALGLFARARRRRVDERDPRGGDDVVVWDVTTRRASSRRGVDATSHVDVALDVRLSDASKHGFSGTAVLVLVLDGASATVAESHARAGLEPLVDALAERGLAVRTTYEA